MKLDSMRKVSALSILACVAAQLATGSMPVASALMLVLHGSHHAHAVSLVSEDGHRHVVLSHEMDRSVYDHRGAVDTDGAAAVFSEGEHVFHFASADPADRATRRKGAAPAAVMVIAAASPFASAPASGFRLPPERLVSSADLLRTVVLRL
jgi:hypothetical protein